MKTLTNISLFAIMLLFSSCLKNDLNDLNQPSPMGNVGDFLFETTLEKDLEVQFNGPKGKALEHLYFEIYSENPFELDGDIISTIVKPEKLIVKGNSDNSGKAQLIIRIPTHVNQLYLCPFQSGLQQYYELNLSDGTEFFTIEPASRQNLKSDKSTPGSNQFKQIQLDGYLTLGSWNSSGLPDYLEAEGDVIPNDLLVDISASLPEGSQLPNSHPQYLANAAETNLIITEDCNIWITFVHEGAGWRNVVGYYTYPIDSEPQVVGDIDNPVIMFPNFSYAGGGGELQSGDKVMLKYYDNELEELTDVFPSGTVVGWFLIGNGWNGQVTGGNYIHYSNENLNIEDESELQRHNVLLFDQERELLLSGFEDIRRDNPGCDQDFNDAIFYATLNPITAANLENVQVIDDPTDTDEDGVSNVFDQYPDDPTRAYNNFYPSENTYGTLVFEDLWPYKGDYDFNDLVIDYNFMQVTNGSNNVTEFETTIIVRAVGAGYQNGFGIELNTTPGNVQSVNGSLITDSYIELNGNGTESAQSKAVVVIFDNSYGCFAGSNFQGFINTDPNKPGITPAVINVTVDFADPMSLSAIGTPPYNPFIIVDRNRDIEVHLPNHPPTDLADQNMLGTGHDVSNANQNEYYITQNYLPWALDIPSSFSYPKEKLFVIDAYLKFEPWATSSGNDFSDWYDNKPGYRNTSNIYNN